MASVAMAMWDVPQRADAMFAAVGAFLVENGLGADPSNYDFAYRIIAEPEGPLAQAVTALTEGGVRLTARDIKELGGNPVAGPILHSVPSVAPDQTSDAAVELVTRTQQQVERFSAMMQAMHADTRGFSRDLRASVDAFQNGHASLGADEVIRLTGIMLDRVRDAEERMEAATRESETLRAELDVARNHARLDPLTGLPNRRAVEETFAELIGQDAPVCVAICDVDRFKSVNDRFGHPIGDRVLRAIGELLAQSCDDHLVARYGGEEFAVIFRHLDLAAAHLVLDRARERVAAKRYRLRETDVPLGSVTFSAGLTEARPHESVEDVIGRADTLLYAAKEAGRNRLICG